MMRLENNPCKTCTEHTGECHATCELYKAAKAAHEEKRKQIFAETPIREYMAQAASKRKSRYLKRK